MKIEVEKVGSWVLVTVDGRIDSFNYKILQEKLKTLVKIGKRFIALDLTRSDFLNIASVRMCRAVARSLTASKGELIIVSTHPRISSLFETLGQVPHLSYFANSESFHKKLQEPTP